MFWAGSPSSVVSLTWTLSHSYPKKFCNSTHNFKLSPLSLSISLSLSLAQSFASSAGAFNILKTSLPRHPHTRLLVRAKVRISSLVMGIVNYRRHCYHNHHRLLSAFTFLLFFTTSAAAIAKLGGGFREREVKERGSGSDPNSRVLTQERLDGPGSSPPTCRSKCGRCFPCKPVHVLIHPGFSMPLEYYPEAWRCKCGNKLFMP